MIELPKRSVTRFFIPLIDVLVLLFCVFLFLPLVGSGDASTKATGPLAASQQEPKQQDSLLEEIFRLRAAEQSKLRSELQLKVLEIAPENGELFDRSAKRRKISSQDSARALIEEDKLSSPGRQLLYLILYPRQDSAGFPTRRQREDYEHWFSQVLCSFEIPGATPEIRRTP